MIEMDKKYTTRDGRAVRILCVDGPGEQPVIGIVDGEDGPDVWASDGTWDLGYENSQPKDRWNLIPASTKVEMWAVVYADGDYRSAVKDRFLFSTEAFAQGSADVENREHPSLAHGKAHVVLVTWNREDVLDPSTVLTKHEGWATVWHGCVAMSSPIFQSYGEAKSHGLIDGECIAHVTWED